MHVCGERMVQNQIIYLFIATATYLRTNYTITKARPVYTYNKSDLHVHA